MELRSDDGHRCSLSLICVCFNNPDELGRTLASCKGLDDEKVELLVIDGSTSDSCEQVVSKLALPFVRYVREPDDGMYDAMNKGVRLARGDGILMLNSGDRLYDGPRFLTEVHSKHAMLATHILFGGTIDEFSGTLVERATVTQITAENVRRGEFPSHQSIVVPRSFCRRMPYDLKFRSAADTVFLRQAFTQLPSARLDCVISVFAYGGRSNAAPRFSEIVGKYREVVSARDLTVAERATLFAQLCTRAVIGFLVGPELHRRFQASRARRRAARASS